MPDAVFDSTVIEAPDLSCDICSAGGGDDFTRIAIPAPLFDRCSAMTTGPMSVTAACGRHPAPAAPGTWRGTTITEEAWRWTVR